MAGSPTVELYYDPFDYAIDDDPYSVWKRMRAEAPLYFNHRYNFYALSRYDDVARALPDWQTYRSGRGTTADILFSGIEVPPGILLFEDPPLHDLHRRLLSRVFTPRRMLAVEDLVRETALKSLPSVLGWTCHDNAFGWRSYLAADPGGDAVSDYAAPARRRDLSGLPPTWVGVGTADLLHDEDVDYAGRLQAAGVPTQLDVIRGAFHGFDVTPRNELARSFKAARLGAMRRFLG